MQSSRRAFLATASAWMVRGATEERLPPIRAITRGPKFHWFGYYDKLQFDPSGRYVLGMEVDFEHRSPKPDDSIRLGMVDLQDNDRWIELSQTKAWCWQQGSMLQWLPGSNTDVIFNDREQGQFVSRILNVKTGKSRTLTGPVYALSPDGKWAVSTDFSRLADTRPGYGYAGVPDRYADVLAPEETGIWRMDLTTGRRRLILSYAEVARVPYKIGDWTGSKHKINHLLVSPDGLRFIFLHRRQGGSNPEAGATRMFTASPEGRNLHVLDPYGRTSHFIWRGSTHVMAWAHHPSHGDGFYVYEDRTANVDVIGKDIMTVNGHNTYLPGTGWRWILNDTYPDSKRLQHPYLYDTLTAKRYPLGHFLSPEEYRGEWRCDTHPRSSPDGRFVCIDSPHGGNGRQMYLIDASGITARSGSQ